MVSLFPAMLRIVIEDLVRLLPLRPEACNALLAKGNPEGVLLQWIACQEYGDWAGCEVLANAHGLDREKLIQRHAEAVQWADAALNSNA
jgi:c-di-GMP-related signal transduction protein